VRHSVSPIEADQLLFTMTEGENILIDFARLAGSHATPESYRHTYGYQLKCMIEHWAQMPVVPTMTAADELVRRQASQYLELCRKVKFVTNKNQRKECTKDINTLEYILGLHYLRTHVKFIFCTISSSAHPVLIEGFEFPELIIDEVAHESTAGIATILGAFTHCIKHITLCGDHKQFKAVYLAQDSNVGHNMLSRKLFSDMVEDAHGRHNTFMLDECYRMLPEHLKFTSGFYNNVLRPNRHCRQFDRPLQNSLEVYWSQQLRTSFRGSKFSVAQDVSGVDCKMSNLTGTTTKYNPMEAEILAWRLKDMIGWIPPQNTPDKAYRPIVADDFIVISAYTGQIQEIRRKLKSNLPGQQDVDISGIRFDIADALLATTNQSQGKERNIAMVSLVINMGGKRVLPTEPYPITFVADDHNINVMLSRQRIGRYIFGDLRTMVQMKVDGGRIVGRHNRFFELLKDLWQKDSIVSMEEMTMWRNSRSRPEDREIDFAHLIQPR
jgi:superfamily I DNA and/or RNA helicase